MDLDGKHNAMVDKIITHIMVRVQVIFLKA